MDGAGGIAGRVLCVSEVKSAVGKGMKERRRKGKEISHLTNPIGARTPYVMLNVTATRLAQAWCGSCADSCDIGSIGASCIGYRNH
jgi:hypothetical protein